MEPGTVHRQQQKLHFRLRALTIGFRLTAYTSQANGPGYHLHFLTQDRKSGGHVPDCEVQNVRVEIDSLNEWRAVLPGNDAFLNVDPSNYLQ